MHALREEYSTKSFEGIGVSVPGRVHPVTKRALLAPNLKWHDFDLKCEVGDPQAVQNVPMAAS
jgi:transcriptional regulator of PTS gene